MSDTGPVSALSMENPQGGLDPRNATNKLDDDTDHVDELNYFSSFDPSVIPYKRGVAQNAVRMVDGDYAFYVEPGRFERVDIARAGADEDVFWGTFLIKSSPGTRAPIPSVAPSQKILEVKTTASADIRISKDRAGNFYVESSHSGLVRLNIKISVPRYYFDGEFSSDVRWSDFPSRFVPQIPAQAGPVANQVLEELGVSRRQRPRDALIALVEHFRDFEGKPFPAEERGGDVYLSIATKKIGVCRHRSFAFVITAAALGIPSRYVYNEAHAFVEVFWPGQGWRRIDLGGAAQDVLLRAAEQQQRVHDGGASDPLPHPPAYQEEIERMADQEKARQEAAMARGDIPGDGNGTNGGFDIDAGPMNRVDDGPDSTPGLEPDGAGSDPGDAADIRDTRATVLAQVTEYPEEIRRGQPFTIGGKLTDIISGRALADRSVKVVIGSPSGAAGSGQVLATTRTAMDGSFEAKVELPEEFEIGLWSLRVVFDGDDDYQPAESR